MIRCYVAGPIGANDDGRNGRVVKGIAAGVDLLRAGFVPVVPHFFATIPGADELLDYEGWMRVCFALVEGCDVLVRIPGHSPGADREVEHARACGMPVFFGVEALVLADAWGAR